AVAASGPAAGPVVAVVATAPRAGGWTDDWSGLGPGRRPGGGGGPGHVGHAVGIPGGPVARRGLDGRDRARTRGGVGLDRCLDLAALLWSGRIEQALGVAPHPFAPRLDELQAGQVVARGAGVGESH